MSPFPSPFLSSRVLFINAKRNRYGEFSLDATCIQSKRTLPNRAKGKGKEGFGGSVKKMLFVRCGYF